MQAHKNDHPSKTHTPTTRLIWMKRLSLAMVTLGVVLVFGYVPALRPAWRGLYEFTSQSRALQVKFLAIIVGGGAGLILCAAFVVWVEVKYRGFDIHKISFTNALRQRNLPALLILYPVTLLMEECLFRGLLLFGCLQMLPPSQAFLLNAVVFGLYHVHTFLSSHDKEITGLFMVTSFIIGLLLGPLFLYFGIWGCFLFHIVVISLIYLLCNKIDLKQEKKRNLR